MRKGKFLAVASLAVLLSACGGMSKMAKMASDVQYEVLPKVLELHGDSVALKVNVTFPPKYFQKTATLEVTPVLKYEGGEVSFQSMTLQGESVQANNKVVSYDNGGTFTFESKVKFEEAMRKSELYASLKASIKDESEVLPEQKVADGVMSTALLLDNKALAIPAADKFMRVTEDTKGATIFFVINQASIANKELKKEELAALQNYIKSVASNDRMEFKGVEIKAFASPDGEEALNDKLAANRMKNSDSYFKNQLKKSKIKLADSVNVSTSSLAEDWDGFKTLMQESDIQDKELILRVLSMYSDPVVREREIKNIAAAYEEVADKILPQLRRSQLSVNVAVIGYSDEELKEMIANGSEDLTVEELLYAATLASDNNEKLSIYQKAAAKYGDDWRTNNNVGYINYEMGNLAEAKAAFEKAKEADASNTTVLNNLGCVAMMEGDYASANDYFSAAAGAGPQVSNNQGILATKQGDYEKAINLFETSRENSFNWALAKLLNYSNTKNSDVFDASLGILDKIEDQSSAKIPYLKAVICARKQDSEGMLNNLRAAVEKDNSLGAYAAKDIEFAQFADQAAFQEIAK